MSTKNFFVKTIYLIFNKYKYLKKLFLEIINKILLKGFVILFTNSKYCGKKFEEEFKYSLKYASHLEVASGYFSYELLNELKPAFLRIASAGSCKLLFGMIYRERGSKKQIDCLINLNRELRTINSESGVYITIENYHGKIFRFFSNNYGEKIYVGSSNLSYSGFGGNKEFNLEIKDEQAKQNVRTFLEYLFHEKDTNRKIGFPIEDIELRLKNDEEDKENGENSLKNFEINKDSFPTKRIDLPKMKIKHRPEKQPKSSLNLYFGKGRKVLRNGRYVWTPREWFEVEITSQKDEQLHPIYPKDDTNKFDWTAYIQDNVKGKEKYYKIPMTSCSGTKGLPKSIESKDRNILGELIKGKMERSGALRKYELITQETLASYGKDYIELHKMNSKEYFMEF